MFFFPGAMLASFAAWTLVHDLLSGVASTYGGGILRSLIGLSPTIFSAAVPAAVFVVSAVMLSPSRERKVSFIFFSLSLLFSPGGLELLAHQGFSHVFWLAAAVGIILGALLGLFIALRIQSRRSLRQEFQPISKADSRAEGSA
jgi:hypothetical protein